GVPIWTNIYGTYYPGDQANAITVDDSGNVFVTGYVATSTLLTSPLDYATVKYSNAGVRLWNRRYSGPGNNDDQAGAIAVDSSGNVFVTGYSQINATSSAWATLAYSTSGVPLWTNRYSGSANGYIGASAIALDRNGNVFVAGSSYDGTNTAIVTIKYS